MNQAETAVLEQGFKKKEFDITELNKKPDIVVVNTCTVTENGDADTRRLVNKINKDNPHAKIALIGCQAQILKEKLLKLPGVTWVIGNQLKMELPSILTEEECEREDSILIAPKIERKAFTQANTGLDPKRTRANLKIQDGCDFYCSFCTIPFARGPARSREYNDVIKEAIELAIGRHKEIVLTGINIGTYKNNGKTVIDIIERIEKIEGIKRIRISSIEPTTIPKELIYKMKESEKLCRYLHIPIQAATDVMLEGMSRKYSLKEFDEFINFAYREVTDICIGTDVIVGFPGESEELYLRGEDYLREAPINYFHVFSYSERQMARSKKLENQVSTSDISKRSERLRTLSSRKKHIYLTNHLGESHNIIIEQFKNGYWWGHTDNYIKVGVECKEYIKNKEVRCKLNTIKGSSVIGEMVG